MSGVNKPFGQTSLYDAIAADRADGGRGVEVGRVGAAPAQRGRRDHRRRRHPQPADAERSVGGIASGIDVPVYIVAVVSAVDDPRENDDDQRAGGRVESPGLARWTGGELFIASAPAHASIAARQIIGELRHQYVLAFEASARAGWRPLEVRTRKDRLTVRARSGYGGGEPSSESEHSRNSGKSADQHRPGRFPDVLRRRQ